MIARNLTQVAFGVALALTFAKLGHAHAQGSEGGGGGNGIVCFAPRDQNLADEIRSHKGEVPNSALNKIISIEALDLNQASQRRGYGVHAITPRLVPVLSSTEDEDQYISRVLARFDRNVPAISDLVRRSRKAFTADHVVEESRALKRIADAEEFTGFETGPCVLATIAAQYFSGETAYLHIDSRLFNHPKHGQISRNALILHEDVYLQGRKLGQLTSRATRELVGIMLTEYPAISIRKLITTATDLGFIKGVEQDLYSHRLQSFLVSGIFSTGPMGDFGAGSFGHEPIENSFFDRFYGFLQKLGVTKESLTEPDHQRNSLYVAWIFFKEMLVDGTVAGHRIHLSKTDSIMLTRYFDEWEQLYYDGIDRLQSKALALFRKSFPVGAFTAELNSGLGLNPRAGSTEIRNEETWFEMQLASLVEYRVNQSFETFEFNGNPIIGGRGKYGDHPFPLGQLKVRRPMAEHLIHMIQLVKPCDYGPTLSDREYALCAFEKLNWYSHTPSGYKINFLNLDEGAIVPPAPHNAVDPMGERALDRTMRNWGFWYFKVLNGSEISAMNGSAEQQWQ